MKNQRLPQKAHLLIISLLCLLLGLSTSMCSPDSDSSSTGRLTLLLVDDPIDTVTSLNVTIEAIEIHGNGPPRNLYLNEDVEQPVNILELENGLFATLIDGNNNENILPAGTYGNLKILISDASITFTEDPNEVPTAATVPPSKFNVGGPFTISEGQITELFLVFNAHNALHQTGNDNYIVNPSLKIVSKTVSGSVRGSVSPPPGENEGVETRVKVFANQGTENESATFAAEDGSFELIPLRAGTHTISAKWITLEGNIQTDCRVHEHGDVVVVAEQVTEAGTITLPEDASLCEVAIP